MPTPAHTHIPVTLRPTQGLDAVIGNDSIQIPTGIMPGQEVKVAGEIWAKILPPTSLPPVGTHLLHHVTIKLEATMPLFNRKLEHFKFKQKIAVQYPLEFDLQQFQYLDSVPRGSIHNLTWPVRTLRCLTPAGPVA